MQQILTIVISVLGVGGVVSGIILRKIDSMEKRQDEHEAARVEESVLIIRGLQAVGHLAEATAIAQRDGHTNGEMKTAMSYYKAFTNDMNAYLLKQNAVANHRTE